MQRYRVVRDGNGMYHIERKCGLWNWSRYTADYVYPKPLVGAEYGVKSFHEAIDKFEALVFDARFEANRHKSRVVWEQRNVPKHPLTKERKK